MAYAYPHWGRWQTQGAASNFVNRLLPHITCVVARSTIYKRWFWVVNNHENKVTREGYAVTLRQAKNVALATGWEINKTNT